METRAVKRRKQEEASGPDANNNSSTTSTNVTSGTPTTPTRQATAMADASTPSSAPQRPSSTSTSAQIMFPMSPSLVVNATLSPQFKLASLTPFFGEVFSSKHFSDVTIQVEGRAFPAHRLVLCSVSAPFRAMLMGPMREARQDVVTLEDVRADTFELWLEFIYGREVTLSNENVLGLLELAVMFDVSDLRDQCCQALESTLSEETAWLILEVADRWHLTDLRARSFNFVINSFERLTTEAAATTTTTQASLVNRSLLQPLSASLDFGQDFLAASSSVVIDVLSSDFLNTTNEMQVFEQATRWLAHHHHGNNINNASTTSSSSSNRHEGVASEMINESILSLVRFGLIPVAVLNSQVLSHPLMQTASLQSLVHEAVRLGSTSPTTTPTTTPTPTTTTTAAAAGTHTPSKRARTTKRDRRVRDERAPVLNPRTPFACKYEAKASLRGHADSVCALKVFRNFLFSGGSDNAIAVWDIARGTGLTVLREHSDMVLGLDVWVQQRTATIAGTTATSSTTSSGCRTRSSSSGARRHITTRVGPNHNHTAPTEVCRLISCSDDETIRVWNMSDWTVEKVLVGHRGGVNAVLVVNGNRLYSGAKDHKINVWELGGSWQCLATMEGHRDGVLALAQVGHKLVSAADDWTIRVWDTSTFTCDHVLEGHSDAVLSLLVVGSRLLSASVEIKVWDTTTWTCDQTVRGHEGGVFGLASAGNQVFSASEDGSVKVWDASTLTCLRTLTHHRDAVFAVAVHNNRLITASADSDIVLWS